MREKVERYSCGAGDGMFDNPEGYWVQYSDYQHLKDQIRELRDSLEVKSKEHHKKARDKRAGHYYLVDNMAKYQALVKVAEQLTKILDNDGRV